MEKQLRSSLQASGDDFITTASKFALKSSKSTIKSLIHGVEASSDLCSSLPLSLGRLISRSIQSFVGENPNPNPADSPVTQPAKRSRKSSRISKTPEPEQFGDVNKNKQRIVQKLHVFAYVTRMCISHPESVFSVEDLLHGAQSLHDNLITFDSDSDLSAEIVSMCEDWWKKNLAGRESLISQALPVLLSRSLTMAKKIDVHRVYALREAFALFDFEDESIEDLKLLIIRCVVSPMYMKVEEGRRFVAFAFGLSGQLLKELVAMIRSQIPLAGKYALEAYGDVLFRAWKVADESSREEIESRFLQGMIEGAIHAKTETLSASIRRVLGAFVDQRTTSGVEKLLFRLAEPLIFRSLQVANSNVRKNTLHLLLDLFPLEDPDSTKEEKDTLLGTQFYLVEKLLVDDHPDTRVVAVEGCCRVLNLFWEIIPSPTIPKILMKIFDDMSHDVSNEVRLSTLNGIIYLLGNPQSHEILKVLLPRLKHLILDKALSIRRAMLDLLLVIRDIQNFQFNKVVVLDVLLEILATDQTDVAQKITKLLMPSYFPSMASTDEACQRCFALIKRSPIAGARFCKLAALEGASLKSLLELVKGLVGLVLSAEKLPIDYTEGLLLAASNICSTLSDKSKYESSLKELFVGEKLKRLFNRATGSRPGQSSIFKIASAISVDEVDVLLDGCMASITKCVGLSGDVERQAEVRSAHNLLSSCGRLDCMVEVLESLLQKTAYHCHLKYGTEVPKLSVTSTKRKKSGSNKMSAKWKHVGGKKLSDFEEDYLVSVGIAWQIKDLLQSEDTRKPLLESQYLESLFLALKIVSEISISQCVSCQYMDESPLLAYTALSLHLTLENITVKTKNSADRKNSNSDSSEENHKRTVLEQTSVHVLDCTNKLFGAGKSEPEKSPSKPKRGKSNRKKQRPKESEAGSSGQSRAGFANKVKMLTTVLQFMTDSASMGFPFHNHERYLKFASDYMRHLGTSLRDQQGDSAHFEDEEGKDSILCLKSSLTYAAKLLSLALKNATQDSSLPPSEQIFILANDIFDGITTIELYMGSGHAARIAGAAKPWLPDLVLALGSLYAINAAHMMTSLDTILGGHFPSWLSVLAKTEVPKIAKTGSENEDEDDGYVVSEEFPVSRKIAEMSLALAKRSHVLVDAFGEIFLVGSRVGLERREYVVALGLVHFVCTKMFGPGEREWGVAMMAALKDLYPKIVGLVEEEEDDDEREKLESARVLLDPIWTHHLYQTGNLFDEQQE